MAETIENVTRETMETGDHVWNESLILRPRSMFGTRGRGGKVHRLYVDEVVGVLDPQNAEPGTFAARFLHRLHVLEHGGPYTPGREPVYFSVRAACNTNGQHTAQVRTTLGERDVTCKACNAVRHRPRG